MGSGKLLYALNPVFKLFSKYFGANFDHQFFGEILRLDCNGSKINQFFIFSFAQYKVYDTKREPLSELPKILFLKHSLFTEAELTCYLDRMNFRVIISVPVLIFR